MSFIYGPPVTGDNFINRTKEIKRLISEIESRTTLIHNGKSSEEPHIEISAPRRIGKSSLLLETQRRLHQSNYLPIYIQLLDVSTIEEFFDRLRSSILDAIPISKSTSTRILSTLKNIKIDLFKLKPTVDENGSCTVSFEDIVKLDQGTWKDMGTECFNLLRKYTKLNFVLFLDEMGFVRKLKDDDPEKLEFLNFLDVQLENTQTPVTILCGSQNFFLILRNIKPEIYHLWRRKFMRLPIKPFNITSTIDKLLMPNFRKEEVFKKEFFTEKILTGISEFIYFITNGYPSITQIIGKEITFEISYYFDENSEIDLDILKDIFFDIIKNIIFQDSQAICKELLSEEALGTNYAKYKTLIYDLYNNPTLTLDTLITKYKDNDLTELLRDLEEQQYIELDGTTYKLIYPFLKYYIWHPHNDKQSKEELMQEWDRIFSDKMS